MLLLNLMLSVVQLMKSSASNHLLEPLLTVTDCRNLLMAIPLTWIDHIHREANQCIDALPKLGSRMDSIFVLFFYYPLNVMENFPAIDKATTFVIVLFSIFV